MDVSDAATRAGLGQALEAMPTLGGTPTGSRPVGRPKGAKNRTGRADLDDPDAEEVRRGLSGS